MRYMPRRNEEGISRIVTDEFIGLLENLANKYRLDRNGTGRE